MTDAVVLSAALGYLVMTHGAHDIRPTAMNLSGSASYLDP